MKSITTVSISDIRIGERHRQDPGDIDGLARSIAAEGLLQPIGGRDPDGLHQSIF